MSNVKEKNTRLKDIELFLLDMDGTVYVGDKLITGAKEKIEEIRSRGKKVCFVTNNSSRAAGEYIVKLKKLGIDISEQEIFTSGDASAYYLNNYHKGKSVFVLGTKGLKEALKEQGIAVVENNPHLVLIGYDTALNYENLCKATTFIMQGVPYFCTHPDVNCPAAPAYVPDVGSFVALIEKSTGVQPFAYCGKPHSPMAQALADKFHLPKEKIAFMGDRLYTDIAFANNNGFYSVLVLSGETDKAAHEKSLTRACLVINSIAQLQL